MSDITFLIDRRKLFKGLAALAGMSAFGPLIGQFSLPGGCYVALQGEGGEKILTRGFDVAREPLDVVHWKHVAAGDVIVAVAVYGHGIAEKYAPDPLVLPIEPMMTCGGDVTIQWDSQGLFSWS